MFAPISERVSHIWIDMVWKAAEVKQWWSELGEGKLRRPSDFNGNVFAAGAYYSRQTWRVTPEESQQGVAFVAQDALRRRNII